MREEQQAGTLYVVATPIGNLEDITARALRIMKEAALICAEDTRETRKLFSHFGTPSPPMMSLTEHASEQTLERILQALKDGSDVAIVSDAGMPLVSDPGAELVRKVVEAGIVVNVVPGPSAVLTALAGSGLAGGSGFYFAGFLPRQGPERDRALARIVGEPFPVVIFESPNRVHDTLTELARWGRERPACIARELTKRHEEYLRGSVGELANKLHEPLRGECVIVLGAKAQEEQHVDEDELIAKIDAELALGNHPKRIAQTLAAWAGRPSREVYSQILKRRHQP
jgi:16S rRNA (cytidine1402-2'-O)-methyltransferase